MKLDAFSIQTRIFIMKLEYFGVTNKSKTKNIDERIISGRILFRILPFNFKNRFYLKKLQIKLSKNIN